VELSINASQVGAPPITIPASVLYNLQNASKTTWESEWRCECQHYRNKVEWQLALRCTKFPSRSAAGRQTNMGINASYIAVDKCIGKHSGSEYYIAMKITVSKVLPAITRRATATRITVPAILSVLLMGCGLTINPPGNHSAGTSSGSGGGSGVNGGQTIPIPTTIQAFTGCENPNTGVSERYEDCENSLYTSGHH
jgi:hypothetical protein